MNRNDWLGRADHTICFLRKGRQYISLKKIHYLSCCRACLLIWWDPCTTGIPWSIQNKIFSKGSQYISSQKKSIPFPFAVHAYWWDLVHCRCWWMTVEIFILYASFEVYTFMKINLLNTLLCLRIPPDGIPYTTGIYAWKQIFPLHIGVSSERNIACVFCGNMQ